MKRSNNLLMNPAVQIGAVAVMVIGGFVWPLVSALIARSRRGHTSPPLAVLQALASIRLLLVLLVLAIWLLLVGLALRVVWTWRTLGARVAYAVLPPPLFEPKPEAIEAFGQQLLGARRRVLAWLDRPACAIRIRFTTTPAGRVIYVVELPKRFRGSLFNAFATAYPGVDVRPLGEVLAREAEEETVRVGA
jgi:hypothetical protein